MKVQIMLYLPDILTPVKFEAHCIKHLGLLTPASPVNNQSKSVWQGLELADAHFGIPSDVELLIGANALPDLLRPGLLRHDSLIAQRTAVGWAISGRARQPSTNSAASSCPAIQSDGEPQWHQPLMQALQRFWEIEDIPRSVRQAPDDEACERIFSDYRRDADGRYIVRLPVKPGAAELLGNGLHGAQAALRSLHRRMNRYPALAVEYKRFMNEYLRHGHMRIIAPDLQQPSGSSIHYIAHHAIWQRGDQGPKVRGVFDGSRPTSTGRSLNDTLYTGRKLQTSLWCVLTRWRQHRVAFCADVKMMYRQIWIDERDVDLQRILWSSEEGETPMHLQLLTVTYGESCAPYLALRVIEQLCLDEGGPYPEAVQAVLKDRYVDDMLSGADDLEAARYLRDQLIQLLKAGGFPLGKWVANTPELLEDLPSEDCLRPTWRQLKADGPVSELGISWNPIDDSIHLTPPQLRGCQRSKREILAAVATLFDPCGWLAPAVLMAKFLMQDLWRARLDWDEELPPSFARRWEAIQDGFRALSGIILPRWIQTAANRDVQLHAFSDASRRAMAAVVYIRVSCQTSPVAVNLLAAKTKLTSIRSLKPSSTPTPRMTVPRLELRAALIAARLLRTLADELSISMDQCYAWSDSTIVLSWLRSSVPVGNSLVDNYVSHIQEVIPSSVWHYVPTHSNPADVASRGADPVQLLHSRDWLDGPSWLSGPSTAWPQGDHESPATESLQSMLNVLTCRLLNPEANFSAKFSNLNVLLRFMVRLRRWVCSRLSRTPMPAVLSPICAQEFDAAFATCVGISQRSSFSKELKLLSRNAPLPARGPLRSLDVFVSPDGILRVGGRLHRSDLPYDIRHPPILDGDSHLAYLVIHWAHQRSIHGGFRSTYIYAVRRAWIIGGKRRIREHIKKCVICARYRARPLEQKMASLPSERVTPGRAFGSVGLDYAGPFQILPSKGRGRRTTKAYVAVFVCLLTKAMHLELVGDLTTDSLMGALTRFCGRRGKPAEIWSDNATHFHRADLQLRKMLVQANLNWSHVSETLAEDGITWNFIPPAAPHFGGLWEAGVKSFKSHLKRTMGFRHLTFEEFSTLLVGIEVVLNSRPLTPISGDPEDLTVLTPGHFLVGGVLIAIPDLTPELANLDQREHWELVKGMRSQFWHRWSREYLNLLQQRHKWTLQRPNLQVGDFVAVLDATLICSDGKWPLGRVIHVHPGADGLVRAATVKTARGVYVRPIVKLALLPITEPPSSDQVAATSTSSDPVTAGGADSSSKERGGRIVGTSS